MRKIAISGGPHTGKSTLIAALESEYPEAYFIPEQAEIIIARELAEAESNPGHAPLLPWVDMRGFNRAVMDNYIEHEQSHDGQQLSFQDRSIWDSMFYCASDGAAELLPEVERLARAANYDLVLFCEPVGTYKRTPVRQETEAEALAKHHGLREVYDNSGLDMVVLPGVSVERRLTMIAEALAGLTQLST